ncbi:MAG: histidine kinase dimerization/phosphoacceptor domain -containing protein [Ignavibacteria bacterium]
MLIIQLIHNLAILVTVSVVSGFINARWSRESNTGKILQGITFGLIAVLAMLSPLILSPGIIFDGRSIVLSLCALFFGPVAGIMAVVARIIIGGGGTIMGVSVILSSIIIGLLANLMRQKKATPVSTKNLFLFGIAVHLLMLFLMLYLPIDLIWLTFRTMAVPVIIFYPIVTVIIGKILIDQENNTRLFNELRESEAKYHMLFNANRDSISILSINPNGTPSNFVELNDAAAEIFGYTREELMSLNIKDLEMDVSDKILRDRIEILHSQRKIEFETVIKNKEGNNRILDVKVFLINYQNEPALMNISRDITERKQAEENIKTSLKEKEILLREIHHRVKNNMQIISSLLELQADMLTDKKMLEVFRDSQNRIQTMALVHEVMYKSPDFTAINVRNYFKNLIEHLSESYMTGKYHIEIELNIDHISLNIDKIIPIGLIVNEAISNSLKHAFPNGKKGRIIFSMKGDSDNNCIISFSDNGIGIPDNKSPDGQKTLGLFLISSLSEQINGELTTSSSDNGTEYKISFRLE